MKWNMSNIWFTSDQHFFHNNIIHLSKRPFSSIEEMNDALIDNFNSVVKSGDQVYHLGDFSFADKEQTTKIFNRLNKCQHHLIRGNHDKDQVEKLPWNWVKDYYELKINGSKFVLFHYPIQSWNGAYRGSIHLHAHSHHKIGSKNLRRVDVGVDGPGFNYTPISIDYILELIKNVPDFTEKNEQL